jgi:hypothetical protein
MKVIVVDWYQCYDAIEDALGLSVCDGRGVETEVKDESELFEWARKLFNAKSNGKPVNVMIKHSDDDTILLCADTGRFGHRGS